MSKSSFQENFSRQESENLKHDDNAFYYFATSILTSLLVPLTYKLIIQPMLYGEMVIKTDPNAIKNCVCDICRERMKFRQSLHRFAFINKWFLVKLGILTVFWYFLIYSYIQVKDIEPLRGFVPYEILGVEKNAPISAVRKAYRKMSRELHPDKNPDNPQAVNEFIQVTKAYTVSKLSFENHCG